MNDDQDPDLYAIIRDLTMTVTAQMLAMKASHKALAEMVLADFERRGAIAQGHPDLLSGYRAAVARHCDAVLADCADDNPGIASEVKRLLDDMNGSSTPRP